MLIIVLKGDEEGADDDTLQLWARARPCRGSVVAFKKIKDGLVIEHVHDMADSAGKLSKFGTADEVIRDLIRSRERDFR